MLISLLRKAGVDKSIAYTILSRVLQSVGGLIVLLLVTNFLSLTEQGYYYTFASILAIQIFFELGLSNIIIQYVAHENAKLDWDNNFNFTGSVIAISRLSSLLKFSIKWFVLLSLFIFIGLVFSGIFFFNIFKNNEVLVEWQYPWILLSLTTALSILFSPIFAFFEGMGKVKEVAKVRLFYQISQLILLSLFFVFGFKLYSSPVAALISLILFFYWVFKKKNLGLIKKIWQKEGEWVVDYKKEIFPFQWKIALSWISGYFIFQLFNPVIFANEGATVAGQMGVTLAALTGIQSTALSWLNTKIAKLSSLISNKQFLELDGLFTRVLSQSMIVCAIALVFFLGVIYFLRSRDYQVASRFLPFLPLFLLSLSVLANLVISAIAIYLRCHKKEPFLLQSVIMGILTGFSTIYFGKIFGLIGIVIGYTFLIIFVSLPWSIFLLKKYKILWH
jgi:O-antigen/teichoic acid export membrane protein